MDTTTEPWHRVYLPVGGWAAPVDIEPPANRLGALRQYPIPADAEHGPLVINAQVLYSRGLTSEDLPRPGPGGRSRGEVPFKRWFVKAFWCATPEEARWLLRYFRQQSNDILDVNAVLGGTGLRPPWAVTPVWVVPATTAEQPQHTTTLGGEGVLAAPERAQLWTWFGNVDNPQPENCFLVLTRYLPEPMPFIEARAVPQTDRLQQLESVARGLDACHRSGIAHCDVKPDNIRLHPVGAVESFVLVDADAVLRLNAHPANIRLTPGYTHPALWAALAQRQPITAEQLKAHDRYGFALVTLGAVAGTALAEALIGRSSRDNAGLTGAEVRSLLRSAWPGDEWNNLIDALVVPFDEPFDFSGDWSSEQWVQDVLGAQQHTPAPSAVRLGVTSADAGLIRRHQPGIDSVRRRLPPALIPPDAPRAVVAATLDTAAELARRQFAAARWPWALALPLLALLLVVTIIRDVLP